MIALCDASQDVLDGICCEACSGIIPGHAPGHPRRCVNCAPPRVLNPKHNMKSDAAIRAKKRMKQRAISYKRGKGRAY